MGATCGNEKDFNGLVLYLDAKNIKGIDSKENLVSYSEDFELWSDFGRSSISSSLIVGPYNNMVTASTITNTAESSEYIYQTETVTGYASGSKFTLSLHMTGSTYSVLGMGGISNGKVQLLSSYDQSLENGWIRKVRQYQTIVDDAIITPQIAIPSTPGNDVFTIWGAQLELKSDVGRYLKTSGTKYYRSRVITDYSPVNNNVTASHATVFESGSFLINGYNQYIRVDNATTLNNIGSDDFTVIMWVWRREAPPGGNGEFLFQNSNTSDGFVISISGTHFRLECRDANSTNSVSPIETADVFYGGEWNHLTVIKKGSDILQYSRGIYMGSSSAFEDLSTTTGYVELGRVNWWSPSCWEGKIDSVSVYNRSLSDIEVFNDYNRFRGNYNL